MSGLIQCPACNGTGGPVNWMWHPGSILENVPCPLCAESGVIQDRRTREAAPAARDCARCFERLDTVHIEWEHERKSAEDVKRWTVTVP